jgi:hypothetical protein
LFTLTMSGSSTNHKAPHYEFLHPSVPSSLSLREQVLETCLTVRDYKSTNLPNSKRLQVYQPP